jgi:hypothetical protein
MMRRIPTIQPKGMKSFFASINSRLSFYEDLNCSLASLELAIWKLKITKQFGRRNILLTTEIKMQCCTESITMVNTIFPNVMYFLTDGDDSNCGVDDLIDEEDEDEVDEDDDWSNEEDDNADDGDHE